MNQRLSHCSECLIRLSTSLLFTGSGLWLLGRYGSSLGAWLLTHQEVSPAIIGMVERVLGYSFVLGALLVWHRRAAIVAFFFGLLLAAMAVFGVVVGGYAFSSLTPGAHALRIATPLALGMIAWGSCFGRLHGQDVDLSRRLLVLAASVVFAVHGVEALLQHPAFTDYIIATVDRFLGLEWDESTTFYILCIIGIVDLAVAFLVLFRRTRKLLVWMAFWGLVTALSRVTAYGMEAYIEVLLRAPHFLIPLALLGTVRAVPLAPSASGSTGQP